MSIMYSLVNIEALSVNLLVMKLCVEEEQLADSTGTDGDGGVRVYVP
jgi:hypothetical protein